MVRKKSNSCPMKTVFKRRRVKSILIDPAVLQRLFTNGVIPSIVCKNGLPEGASFVGFTVDESRNLLRMFFEHPSFDEVDICTVPEEIILTHTIIEKDSISYNE